MDTIHLPHAGDAVHHKVIASAGMGMLKALPREGDIGPIEGIALTYGQAGRPHAYYPECEALVFEPRCFAEYLAKRQSTAGRDVKFIGFHEDPSIVASTAAGTLILYDSGTELRYRAEMDLRDPDAMRIYCKVSRGDVTMASVGCYFLELSEPEMMLDNSEEAKAGLWGLSTDKEIVVQRVIKADLIDISAVGHGAYGSTAVAASNGGDQSPGSGLRLAAGVTLVVGNDGLLRPVAQAQVTTTELPPEPDPEGEPPSTEPPASAGDPPVGTTGSDPEAEGSDPAPQDPPAGGGGEPTADHQPTDGGLAATVTHQEALDKLDELLAT